MLCLQRPYFTGGGKWPIKTILAGMDPAGFGRKQACCSIGLPNVKRRRRLLTGEGTSQLGGMEACQTENHQHDLKILIGTTLSSILKAVSRKYSPKKCHARLCQICDSAISCNLLFGLCVLMNVFSLHFGNFLTRLVPRSQKIDCGVN